MYNFRGKCTSAAYEFFSGALGLILAKGNGKFHDSILKLKIPGGRARLSFRLTGT